MSSQEGGCFRIKSTTLLIGTFDLMVHMMLLATLFASISNPYFLESYPHTEFRSFRPQVSGASSPIQKNGMDAANTKSQNYFSSLIDFPSMLDFNNKKHEQQIFQTRNKFEISLNPNRTKSYRSPNDLLFFNYNTPLKQDRSIAVLVTTCSSLITILLIYGILYNKPTYLMPYFSIKVFQVVVTCLTTLGFYSTLPDVRQWLKMQANFPLKDTIVGLDRHYLELFVFILFLLTILIKLYVVVTVWYCYRHICDINAYRSQSFFSLRTSNIGYVGGGAAERPEAFDENGFAIYKTDDEYLLANRLIGPPPKYEDIVKATTSANNSPGAHGIAEAAKIKPEPPSYTLVAHLKAESVPLV